MPCHHPMPAWKTHAGIVTLDPKARAGSQSELKLPCGGCLGCRKAKAKEWALRCTLELHDHQHATFTTLTYDDKKLPPTLRRRDLQLFIKRLRRHTPNRIRFFACGEYGEQNGRPHYHAILYGCSAPTDSDRINTAWSQGHTQTVAVTPAAIAYTAGYAAKKIGLKPEPVNKTVIDYETGEEYEWQEPFLQMSRNPGIGGTARQHTKSWRDYAILNGTRIPVPKYLHKAWQKTATTEQIENREHEQYLKQLTKERITERMLEAEEQIAIAQQKLQAEKRKL